MTKLPKKKTKPQPLKYEAGQDYRYWQPGLNTDGSLRKIMPDDPLPGVWAGQKKP